METSESLDEARVRKLRLLDPENSTICVICYSSVKLMATPANCLHLFCFHCLVKWSKQKNQCPLCKKGFDAIIHNVRSKTEYDKYQVVVNRPESHQTDSPIINLTDLSIPSIPNFLTNHGQPRRRFTYRTRFEADPLQITRIQELFGSENYTRLTAAEWRKNVYDRRLFALPLPDLTGRFRDCSPQFYRENPAQTHRLIPWLQRELTVLIEMTEQEAIPQILEFMRENLCYHDIRSDYFRDYFRDYLQDQVYDHFVHEFHSFAVSPYDLIGYDRLVDYVDRESEDTTVEISSNESSDSEVQVIDDSPAGSSSSVFERRSLEVANDIELSVNLEVPDGLSENIQTTEVIVESDSDNSEVIFVLALKPPEQRTPEQIFLDSASDSSVEFIPNSPLNQQSNTPSSSSPNLPSKSKKTLSARIKNIAEIDVKHDMDTGSINEVILEAQNLLNVGASTSQENTNYRKRTLGKSSSSNDSSSEERSQLQLSSRLVKKYRKSSKTRRKGFINQKKKKRIHTTASGPKLSLCPNSEASKEEEKTLSSVEHSRIKRVVEHSRMRKCE